MILKFKRLNKIPYSQDHKFYRGIPAGIKFDVEKAMGEAISLRAKGHGGDIHYGNGALFVRVNHLPPDVEKQVRKEFGLMKYGPCPHCNGTGKVEVEL
jgi:hypothetical protein